MKRRLMNGCFSPDFGLAKAELLERVLEAFRKPLADMVGPSAHLIALKMPDGPHLCLQAICAQKIPSRRLKVRRFDEQFAADSKPTLPSNHRGTRHRTIHMFNNVVQPAFFDRTFWQADLHPVAHDVWH